MCAIERRYIFAACRRGLALGLLLFGVSLASLTIADDIWDLIYYDINDIKYNTIDILYGISYLMSGANSNAVEIINKLEEIRSQTDIWDWIYYDTSYIKNEISYIRSNVDNIVDGISDLILDANRNADAIINTLEEISSQTFDVFVVNWQDQYDDNDFAEDITRTVDFINSQLDDLIVALEENIGELMEQLELEFDQLSLDMSTALYELASINMNTYATAMGINDLTYYLTSDYHGVHVKNYNQADLLSGLESILNNMSVNEDIIDVFDEWDNELSYYDPPNLYEPDLDEFSSVSGIVKSAAGAYRSVHVDALEYEMEGQSALEDIDFSGDFEDQTLLENIRSVIDKIMPLDVEISSMYWSLEIPDGVSIFGDAEVIKLVDVSVSDLEGLSVVRSVSGLIYVALGIFVLVRGLR
jgi:hypothetical protein